MMERDEIKQTLKQADELVTELKAHRHLSPDNGNVTIVRFEDAAKAANKLFGVWVCVTACLMMLAAMMVGGFWLSREFGRIDTQFSNAKNTDDIHDAYIQKLRAQQQEKK